MNVTMVLERHSEEVTRGWEPSPVMQALVQLGIRPFTEKSVEAYQASYGEKIRAIALHREHIAGMTVKCLAISLLIFACWHFRSATWPSLGSISGAILIMIAIFVAFCIETEMQSRRMGYWMIEYYHPHTSPSITRRYKVPGEVRELAMNIAHHCKVQFSIEYYHDDPFLRVYDDKLRKWHYIAYWDEKGFDPNL